MKPTAEPNTRVLLRGITRSYPGIQALRGVDLDVQGGEIHALCGENGAGKSTLIRVLAGAVRPDRGEILLDGQPVSLRSPADALKAGIAVIHQELSLVGSLSVAENLALGDEPGRLGWIDRRTIRKRAAEQFRRLGFAVDPGVKAGTLPSGQRQLVEIARALGRKARVLVLDEPTAALSRAEAERLFQVLRDLKSQGLAIVYISHHLDEVLALADRITVLRDGGKAGTWPAAEGSVERLVAAMVGEAVDVRQASARPEPGPVALRVDQARGQILRGISLEVRRGEVVGVTGLAGAGHEELAAILFGEARLESGRVEWQGRPVRLQHPAQARALGIASVPADRRREGLVPTLGIDANITLATWPEQSRWGWLMRSARRRKARELCEAFDIAPGRLSQRPLTLSGGNQQKLLLARWAATEPQLLILNDPTRGIDVRTREAIHRRIEQMAESGQAVLLVTSDTQELLRLADRVIIVRAGQIAHEAPASDLNEHAIVAAML